MDFFFFQAEDGIRDDLVTGVQTCALPIFMEGHEVERFVATFEAALDKIKAPSYQKKQAVNHVLMKVETHNHPTAISPFPGASTGAGGEIRDEGATRRGSKPKAGLSGFTVSKL